MNQPDLGKKIAELRKAKGFTQEELVEKCNLSVRTLQRIESGEVTPRSYTIKTIFAALDYTIYDSSESTGNRSSIGSVISNWLGQLYKYVFDLFNLKTNTMKKITILSISLIALFIGIFAISSECQAQKTKEAVKAIENSQIKINQWINSGQIDSILTMYSVDACDIPNSACGKAELREAFQGMINGGCRVIEFNNLSINVGDMVAVQKYSLMSECGSTLIKSIGLTEWHLTNGKWLIVNDVWVNK